MDNPSQALQSDTGAAVDSGQMAPTVTQTPAVTPTAQPPAQPTQPTAPQSTQAPTAQPSAQPQPNQAQPPKPNLRARIFDTILKAGAGQPIQGPNGQPIPLTKGFMGKAIIANALAGMMAGYGSSETVNTQHGPVRVNNPAKGFAAGAQAGQATQANRQQQMDESQARAYNTVKRNLDLHASMLNLQNATEATQDKSAADGTTLYDGLKSFDESNTDPRVPKFILDTGVTGQELNDGMKSGKYHIGKNSAVLTGWQPHIDPQTGEQTKDADGIPQREAVFAVINPEAIVHFTPELKDALSGMHQDLSRIPDNAAMKAKALLPLLMNKQNYGIAQDAINGWSKKNDELTGRKSETVDVNSLIQSNGTLRKAVPYINKYIGEDPDVMIAGLRKEKDPSAQAAAGVLAHALGIDEDSWKNKREADQKRVAAEQTVATKLAEDSAIRQTPEGQLKLRKMQLENQQLAQSVAQAEAQSKGINVPKNFTANPKSNEMDSGALQSDLLAKGVDVPSNFSALYAIAHNAADLSTLPTTPRKGVNVMPRDQALSYIRTFINPQYQEGDYSASKKLSGELASTRTGTAGGTLLSAGTAANHLNLLEQAGEALNNGDVQAINKLANVVGVAVGKSPAVTFQAIAEQVNSEVAKVVAGGQPNEAELKQNRDNLNNSQSPEQIRNVIRSYVGLMNGRIGEIDDRSMQYFGRHVKGISPTAVQVFNKYGFVAPGQVVVTDPTGKQRFFNDAASADNFKKLAGIR